jgi:hypothetical protein
MMDLFTLLGTVILTCMPHSAIADLRTFQFIVVHALGFSVSTSRLLATDLNTETITSNHYEVFLSFFLQSPWTADSLNSDLRRLTSPILVMDRTENTVSVAVYGPPPSNGRCVVAYFVVIA